MFMTRIGGPFHNVEEQSLSSRNNLGDESSEDSDLQKLNEIGNIVFYISAALIGLMGVFCTLGNGLVLYISNKNKDFGGFREINSVVKNMALSDFLFGVIGCPLTIVWWYWGKKSRNFCINLSHVKLYEIKMFLFLTYCFINQYILGQFGDMGKFAMKNQEWKFAVLRGFYFLYQCASAYFVCLIVALRLKVVRYPLGSDTKRLTRIACIFVWCLVVFINFLPIAASIHLATQEVPCDAFDDPEHPDHECIGQIMQVKPKQMEVLNAMFITVLHVGITLPLALTIFINILLIISVRKMKQKCETKAKKKNWEKLEKLTDGVVISLIVCNVPYIAWYHWSLALYIKTGMGWDGVGGVCL